MTSNAVNQHPHHHEDTSSKVIFGFWVYIMTDCIMFASLFATYAVLYHNTYGAPGIQQITNLPCVLIQTLVLLSSVFVYSLSSVAAHHGNRCKVLFCLLLTFLIGLAFVGLEFQDFSALIANGYTWQTSAFFSAYFGLVGIHWIHVIIGLIWMLVLMVQLCMQNLSATMKTRLICLGMFWNYLNIVWIFIFTIVYLMGVI